MITAGSVRGNCGCAALRAAQLVPGVGRLERARRSAGRSWVAQCHSASPSAWKSQRRARSPARRHRPGRGSSRAGPPTRRVRRVVAGLGEHREPGHAVVLARAAPARPRARRPGATHWTPPSTGRSRVPETTSTRVAGSAHRSASHASSVRRMPLRSCACADRATCGHVRPGSRWLTSRVPAMSTHIGAAGRRHRPRRPDARRPAAGEVDRRDLPRRRQLLHRGARDVRLHRHLARPAGLGPGLRHGPAVDGDLRQRAVPGVRRRSRSSASAPAAR